MNEDARSTGYRIIPIGAAFVERARRHSLDDLDQAVERIAATGGEPCRDVLRVARAGEALILASYSPFSLRGPYREFGPIFLLADPGPDSEVVSSSLLDGPAAYFSNTFALRAYSPGERIVDALLTPIVEAESHILRLLQRPDVAFLHARFGAYGCYGCRIEVEVPPREPGVRSGKATFPER